MIKNVLINGNEIPVEDIRSGKYQERLPFPRAFIDLCLDEREYKGTISATTLLNGPMLTFLKFCTNYTADPQKMAFMVLGSITHGMMERFGHVAEVEVAMGNNSGTFDGLEQNPTGLTLWDYKNSGAYAVAKNIGMKTSWVHDTEAAKAGGKPKKVKSFSFEPENADDSDYCMQLNIYRVMLEDMLAKPIEDIPGRLKPFAGQKVTELRLFFITRDGNTHSARGYGLFDILYDRTVELLPKEEVLEFMAEKTDEVKPALDAFFENKADFENATSAEKLKLLIDLAPRICNSQENWKGNRCKNHCEVAKTCALIESRRK